MFKIEIEINNATNRGWLLYLLGQPKPDVEEDEQGAAGWAMASMSSQTLNPVRSVFERQDPEDPAFVVNVVVNDTNEVVTNVGPDQQATAKDIAQTHARRVAHSASTPDHDGDD